MKTYWDSEGRYRALYQALVEDIPRSGPVTARPRLETLRRAVNAYYDVFNNGGGNRDRDILHFFSLQFFDEDGEKSRHMITYDDDGRIDWGYVASKTEPVMDKLILQAAEEKFGIEIKMPE